MKDQSPSLIDLGLGEVPDIYVLLECAEAARCSASDIVNRCIDKYQVEIVRRRIRELNGIEADTEPDICGLPG